MIRSIKIIPPDKLERFCPTCNVVIYYTNKYNYFTAFKKNACCKICTAKKNGKTCLGKTLSLEEKEKISRSLKGKNTWSKNRKLSMYHKTALLKYLKDHKVSQRTKEKMSLSARGKNTWSKGRKHSEKTKQLMRMKACERRKLLGIKSFEDSGAREFFQIFNKDNNFNLKMNEYFPELGYFADGYDREHHIWAEYDTPYHQYYKQKAKDDIRQNIIIEHFKLSGNPLNQFIRINVTKNDKIEIIYVK